ncbi:hypothetical protein [Clostridioides difficile]|uniref:hypothetical protein n=1 Tax=Clostridioides difficile TaxID=1496 RepID=UPI000D1F9BA5|nr:hypothetical protein [Clostridioides difficile]HBE9444613.1 hypothetical protein [Clostridioides difficile]
MNNELKKGQIVYLKCSEYNHEFRNKNHIIGIIVNKTDEYIEVSIEEVKCICRFYNDTLEEISMLNPQYYLYTSEEVI